MLKETENKEKRLFRRIFLLIAVRFRGEGGVGRDPRAPLATPMIVTSLLFVILRFRVLVCLFTLVCMSK